MLVSIAVNNYKNPELLRLCLNSIKENYKRTDYEIIVANSATEEDTEMMMREDFPEVRFFPFKENVGFQTLVKKGIEESRGDYIFIINGDILLNPGSLEKMLDYLTTHPDVGLLGPQLLNFNGTFQVSRFRFYRPLTIVYRRTFLNKFKFAQKHLDWFLMKDYDNRDLREVDWLMGSALLFSRENFQKVGFMDPRFFMYMEDVDWCRRFWEKGLKVVYYPQATMRHYHGKGSAKGGFWNSIFFNRLTWTHIFSAIKYFWKYTGKPNPRENV